MKKRIILILLISCLFIISGCEKKEENKEIEPGKVTCNQKNTIINDNKDAVLIDVRSDNEYKEGHIDKAINIPYDKITSEITKYSNIKKDTPIIVYCKSGTRSAKAAESLKKAGYTKVYDLGAKSNCD